MGRDKQRRGRRPDHESWQDKFTLDGSLDEAGFADAADFEEAADDRLHRAFSAAYPETYEATAVYDELRPVLVATRRRQLIRNTALTTIAVAIVALAGSAALVRITSPASDLNVIAGPANDETATSVGGTAGSDGTDPGLSPPDPGGAGGQQAPADEAEPVPHDQSTPAPADQQPTSPTAPASDPTTSGATSTAPSVQAPSSASTTTTASGSNATVFQSDCGSITYTVDGRDLTLVGAVSESGGRPDVKSAGPEKIEVSFEGRGDHCEIKVRWKDGTLVVEDEDDGGDEPSE
jgi:hypothetical protein